MDLGAVGMGLVIGRGVLQGLGRIGSMIGVDEGEEVMAFAQVSTNHQNAIRTFVQGVDHQIGTHHPGAHHPHHPKVRGILQTTDPSQVSSGVCSPRAQES